ncbi:hypothetical protein ACMYSQ_010393 [Aspergillus niger]
MRPDAPGERVSIFGDYHNVILVSLHHQMLNVDRQTVFVTSGDSNVGNFLQN